MISEAQPPHQLDSLAVIEESPVEVVSQLHRGNNGTELIRDVDHNLSQPYPLTLFIARKDAFEKRMAAQQEIWQLEKERLRSLRTGVNIADLPQETHEIISFSPR